jgi:starvation-inducible DNA-binding protein
MKSHQTRIDLPSNAKATVIAALNENLAAGIDLALATKQAHWNLKGPQFIAVHEMIDGFRTELDTHVDIIAERIAQLGGTALAALGLYRLAPSSSPIQPIFMQSTITLRL